MFNSNSSKPSINPKEVTMNVLQKAGKFAWRNRGKIIASSVILATGGVAAPVIVTAAGLMVTIFNSN